jgi:hypothetical protein
MVPVCSAHISCLSVSNLAAVWSSSLSKVSPSKNRLTMEPVAPADAAHLAFAPQNVEAKRAYRADKRE